MSLFGSFGERVRQGLRRTRELMDEGLGAVLSIARPVDEAMLDELEETLIAADLGAAAASAFVKRVRDEVKRGRVSTSADVRAALHRFLEEALAGAGAPTVLQLVDVHDPLGHQLPKGAPPLRLRLLQGELELAAEDMVLFAPSAFDAARPFALELSLAPGSHLFWSDHLLVGVPAR